LLGYSNCKGDVITPHGNVHVEVRKIGQVTKLKLDTPHETIVIMPDKRRYVLQAGSYTLNSGNNEEFFGAPITE
jgi:hypothetical protein